MPLYYLNVTKTRVRDLSPIVGLPLVELDCDPEAKLDPAFIRSIPTLKKINSKSVSEWLSNSGNALPSVTQDKTIDLLTMTDVKRDALAGEWSRDGGDLLVKAAKPDAKGTPRLQLPYQPPEEYDFEIEFTPESGTNMVGQSLSAYQRSFSWFLDVQTNAGSKAGFDGLNGTAVSIRTKGTIMRPKFLTNVQRHRSTIEVRRNGLRAMLDGELLVKWGSAPSFYERLEISKSEQLRDALHLGLAAYDRGVRFHKITVREITGAGKVDAGVVSAHSSPDGRTINLLPLVDLKRDVIAGEWVRTADGIAKQGAATTSKGAVRLQLPYQPPEEYDFEVEFTAVAERQSVSQILSAQSRVFSWVVAGYTPQEPKAGFERFDGGATSKPSEMAVPMKVVLEKGRRYVSRVEVRKAGLRGFLNGVELVNWSGDFKRLSPGTTTALRDDKHLGLGAARDVVFHKIIVREINGIGKVDAE